MSDIQSFSNRTFGLMRSLYINGSPHFCLSDICRILDIRNVSDCKSRLKKDGVVTGEVIDSLGRKQAATFINEGNLYKVVFQSRKPEAEQFISWVTDEVLPAIRQNGGYILGQEKLSDSELMAKALLVAQNTIDSKNKQLEEAHKKIEEDAGKVLFAQCVEDCEKTISIGELAKILKQNEINIGQNRLFEWLRNNKYLISRPGEQFNCPTQKAMDLGLFRIKKTSIICSNGKKIISTTVKVTGKGQIYFINKFKELLNQK